MMTYFGKSALFALTLTASQLCLNLAFAGGPGEATAAKTYKLSKCAKGDRLPTKAQVLGHVDGDTIHLQIGKASYSVRLAGMDAQESRYLGKSQGEWAQKAAGTLAELLPAGTNVTLQYGSEACDSYGRLLAHIFRGKLHANAELVRRGLAVTYCVAPDFRHCEEFSRHTAYALEHELGMYSEKGFELPYDFRRRISNQPQRSFVGNLRTKEVLRPGHQNEVPVADRVFFYGEHMVQEPYFLQSQDEEE